MCGLVEGRKKLKFNVSDADFHAQTTLMRQNHKAPFQVVFINFYQTRWKFQCLTLSPVALETLPASFLLSDAVEIRMLIAVTNSACNTASSRAGRILIGLALIQHCNKYRLEECYPVLYKSCLLSYFASDCRLSQ
jgi:hypothetical protein